MQQLFENKIFLFFFCQQELREMVNLPDTRPEMVAADFKCVTEALKGQKINKLKSVKFSFVLILWLKLFCCWSKRNSFINLSALRVINVDVFNCYFIASQLKTISKWEMLKLRSSWAWSVLTTADTFEAATWKHVVVTSETHCSHF